MIKVGIVGGTGYTGAELLRLLSRHPQVQVVTITSRKESGLAVGTLFPNLRDAVRLHFMDPQDAPLTQCDVVFFATPNGIAMEQAPSLLQSNVKVVDLAADFRLRDAALWQKWYGMLHTSPQLLQEAVYGLPELNRERIRTARLVANPGCYPTAVQLGFLPLLENDVVDSEHLIADTKSGVSGAGRKEEINLLFSEASDNFKAYNVAGHRHLPEITEVLSGASARPIKLTFVPHLTPLIRGIHATLYAPLKKRGIDLQALYEERYINEPFIDVLPAGSHPETRSVRGCNMCRIAVHRSPSEDVVIVLVVEDNLVKGAAGQAVQNMNIMFGIPETTGLEQLALIP